MAEDFMSAGQGYPWVGSPDRPNCDWWVAGQYGRRGHRCYRQASFRWGDRYICANHASGWIRQGKVMYRLPGVVNPYPGSWLWDATREEDQDAVTQGR